GEEYVPLGARDLDPVARAIAQARPDAILNTLNGDSNIAFFHALRAAGVTPARVPTMSFSLAEQEIRSLPGRECAGAYAAGNYSQSVAAAVNQQCVRALKARFAADRVTSDPIEAAYVGVHLGAAAAAAAGSAEPAAVRAAVADRSIRGPGGM